jgi:hypothetical protein
MSLRSVVGGAGNFESFLNSLSLNSSNAFNVERRGQMQNAERDIYSIDREENSVAKRPYTSK